MPVNLAKSILPVIDLQGGRVVRGVAGQRHLYQPIVSVLTADCSPVGIGKALVSRGCQDVYLADLDAIAGKAPALDVYRSLLELGLFVWIDAGIGTRQQAEQLHDFSKRLQAESRITWIAGLESLPNWQLFGDLLELFSANQVALSLDLRGGRPMVRQDADLPHDALLLCQQAIDLGLKRLIVLDLSSVGMADGGSTLALCAAIRARWPQLELTSGGGVRNGADVAQFCDAGCQRVLVASALHNSTLHLPVVPPSSSNLRFAP